MGDPRRVVWYLERRGVPARVYNGAHARAQAQPDTIPLSVDSAEQGSGDGEATIASKVLIPSRDARRSSGEGTRVMNRVVMRRDDLYGTFLTAYSRGFNAGDDFGACIETEDRIHGPG